MAIKQIGELPERSSIPYGAKIVVDNNNDSNLAPVDALVDDVCETEVNSLNTHDKSIGGAINELYALTMNNVWIGTQAEYNALETYDPNKFYLINNAPVLLWVGSQEDYDDLGTYSQNTLYVII